MTGSWLGLIAVFVLVAANGFFVAAEFAIVAVRKSRLEELVRERRAGAVGAQQVVAHLDTYIAATQFGITLASLALGWIGEPALAHIIEPAVAVISDRFAAAASHGAAVAISFALITGLHIVIGELAPKGLALQRPEQTAMWVARPLQAFHAVFKWPVAALNGVGNAALRLFGLKPASGHEMVHSVDELRLLIEGMEEAGVVDDAEARIARRAFSFGDLTAGALMTPRVELDALPIDTPLDEVMTHASTAAHNQLPMYEDSVDNIVGIMLVRDLLRFRNALPAPAEWRALLRKPVFTPESRSAADLLEDMRQAATDIAVVVDEYGGTAGVVTSTDLLEALVGRFAAPNESSSHGRVEPDGSICVDGATRIEEYEELTGERVDRDLVEQAETLSGLVVALKGSFPDVGDEVSIGTRRVRVEKRDGLRVESLRILPPATPPR